MVVSPRGGVPPAYYRQLSGGVPPAYYIGPSYQDCIPTAHQQQSAWSVFINNPIVCYINNGASIVLKLNNDQPIKTLLIPICTSGKDLDNDILGELMSWHSNLAKTQSEAWALPHTHKSRAGNIFT